MSEGLCSSSCRLIKTWNKQSDTPPPAQTLQAQKLSLCYIWVFVRTRLTYKLLYVFCLKTIESTSCRFLRGKQNESHFFFASICLPDISEIPYLLMICYCFSLHFTATYKSVNYYSPVKLCHMSHAVNKKKKEKLPWIILRCLTFVWGSNWIVRPKECSQKLNLANMTSTTHLWNLFLTPVGPTGWFWKM